MVACSDDTSLVMIHDVASVATLRVVLKLLFGTPLAAQETVPAAMPLLNSYAQAPCQTTQRLSQLLTWTVHCSAPPA